MLEIDSIKILDERNMKLVPSKNFMIEPSQCPNNSSGSAESQVLLHRRDLPTSRLTKYKERIPSELIETCGKLTNDDISRDKTQ